jgi:hypothetical protein
VKWKCHIAGLVLLAVPAFSGYPLGHLPWEPVAGVCGGSVLYLLVSALLLLWLLGAERYGNALAVAVLITVPVVCSGSVISWLLLPAGGEAAIAAKAAYSRHYVSLAITMLTVIPLALAFVAVIPFHDLENQLLRTRDSVSRREKVLLIVMRVFNHIVYYVIPDIMEVVREEKLWHLAAKEPLQTGRSSAMASRYRAMATLARDTLSGLVYLAVEGICASIRYIPVWALEIARLPEKRTRRDR